MTLPIEYQNLIARRALEVVQPTPGAVDGFEVGAVFGKLACDGLERTDIGV